MLTEGYGASSFRPMTAARGAPGKRPDRARNQQFGKGRNILHAQQITYIHAHTLFIVCVLHALPEYQLAEGSGWAA
jgi:hypothetical protein